MTIFKIKDAIYILFLFIISTVSANAGGDRCYANTVYTDISELSYLDKQIQLENYQGFLTTPQGNIIATHLANQDNSTVRSEHLFSKHGELIFPQSNDFTKETSITYVSSENQTSNESELFIVTDIDGSGVLNSQQQWLIKPFYNQLTPLNCTAGSATFSAERNNIGGLINQQHQVLYPFSHQTVFDSFFNSDLYVAIHNSADGTKELTVIDDNGNSYYRSDKPIDIMGNGLYTYHQNGKFGFFDKFGHSVQPPIYDDYEYIENGSYVFNILSNNLFIINIAGKFGVMDLHGNQVIEPVYSELDFVDIINDKAVFKAKRSADTEIEFIEVDIP